ncbi:MAG: hypothetical protein FJZ08_05455 [Candidatus Omnitrophica bacterium]|nr:hypothetical protein [Candidatus Omnitrophota bacterium]
MGQVQEDKVSQEVKEGKFFAAISYISFLCVVSLILKKENKFVIHHAKQGLLLFVFEVVAFILSMIPLLGWLIRVFGILFFLLASLWGIVNSLNGNYSRIPLISKAADSIVL